MIKATARVILLAMALFALAACQQTAEPEASLELAGTNWILSSLNGELPVADTAVTLQFGTDGTVFGSDGCNRFNTTYTQDGANLTINQSAGISSMMACEEPVMTQASDYMAALGSVTSFTASTDQLSLKAGDEVVATFVAGTVEAEAPVQGITGSSETGSDLAGTGWVLSSLNGEMPIYGTAVTLQFGTDGTASGTDGCNQFSLGYTQDGSSLTFDPAGPSTMMACEEPVMTQATDFMAALAATDSFTSSADELSLLSGGQVVATFVAQPTNLADTAWDVVSYNNGRDAVVGLITGTEISAYFGLEDDLSGSAGCNQYVTSFTASDGSIEIGPIGSTMRFCAEPAGVMEQESEYLVALQSAATYSIQGNMLQMRTADDQLAVIMTRKLVVDLPEPDPAVPTGRVNSPQGLNIRSGPGVNFPVIGFARDGDEGEIVGRSVDGRWWAAAVPTAPGGIGWVSADFVVATNTENVPVIEVAPPIVVLPTAAPTPTPPPAPTATPVAEISFGADRTNINQGECTTLRWSVNNIQAVWVYPLGEQFERFPRTGQGSEQVCPTVTTTYEMRVLQRDGTVIFRQVTINVSGAAPDPLAGTRWEVVNYNNGRGALVTPLAGTRLTLEFGANGSLGGSAGCNTYTTSYQVNGSNITIGLPASTQQLCTEPAGIMEQETDFLTSALPSAATFRINGSSLEIMTAGGQIAVLANRIP
ncbi:MAG: META domain-containing protein [Ardenticatenaceae bacterium]|nr:META domain-containing protein [Ardenticatenaceae bacterium]